MSTVQAPDLQKLEISNHIRHSGNEQGVQSAPPYSHPFKYTISRSWIHCSNFWIRSILEEREPSYKSEEMDEFHISSTESLHEFPPHVRKRTVSGNYSERSTNSFRELTFIKSIHEHHSVGTDSRLFLTIDQGRAPFAVTSIIPWQKAPVRQTTRLFGLIFVFF